MLCLSFSVCLFKLQTVLCNFLSHLCYKCSGGSPEDLDAVPTLIEALEGTLVYTYVTVQGVGSFSYAIGPRSSVENGNRRNARRRNEKML